MPFPLICPVCRKPLTWDEKTVSCSDRHAFDIAKEGYINLYRTNRRAENQPGDSREMLRARRAFLETGWYEPLSNRMNTLASEWLNWIESPAMYVLDAGCGEGYYLGRMLTHLRQEGPEVTYAGCGIDISKEAIRMAARRYSGAVWCVANAADHIPCEDNVVHLACSVFAPRFGILLRRVMAADGLLLTVLPGPNHLSELNEVAMAHKRDTSSREADAIAQCEPNFRLADRYTFTYRMALDHGALWDLYRMIPVYWRSTREAQAKIHALEGLEVTADFVILAFTPVPPSGRPV